MLSTKIGVEGLEVVEGEHYLSCETPEDGLRSLKRVLGGEAAPIVAAARRLVEQRFDQETAVRRMQDVIASHLPG